MIFTKFGGKVARKNPLDFDGNPNRVTLGLGLGLGLGYTVVIAPFRTVLRLDECRVMPTHAALGMFILFL